MSVSPHVIDVSEADFEVSVIERSHEVPVVVDFWAEWCGPCRVLGPVLEKLADRDDGRWVLAKVDTQTNQRLAESFGIQGIPNVKAFKNGEVVDEFAGALPEYAVDQWLQKIVGSESDAALADAQQLEADGDLPGAVEAYINVLGTDPDHALTRAALVSALVRTGDVAEARGLVDEISEYQWGTTDGALEQAWLAVEAASARPRAELEKADTDLEARYELAMKLASEGEWEGALQHLLGILAADRGFRDDIGRRAMIRLFAILGDEHELTNTFRGRMGAVMYV